MLTLASLYPQAASEDDINRTIELFFEGFHQRDTAKMRSVMWDQVRMQRIGMDAQEKPFLKDETVSDFLTSIASLPDTLQIEERLHFYTIQTDGAMANAWTPYTFYVNGEIHHCGVNSFQLFYEGEVWKIIYIVDTRQAEPCTDRDNTD
jgi:hypothetical protein